MAQDIANLMDRLYEEKKFGTALFIADTCQAFTLFDKVTTPNVLALGTSLIGESAYAHHSKLCSVEYFPMFLLVSCVCHLTCTALYN
ncbi:MAG: glycosylphosphatidylinositol transamidase (GPIT) subunit GPI8 [Bacillariaceae sp.]|jgi:phosphatidylinositol glycan class K